MRNKLSVIWIRLLSLVFVTVSLFAQAQVPCKIQHYSTEQGLSHDIITCMFKDHEGYMWFGTWDGINKFDGRRFTSFKSAPGDSSQMKNDRVDQITEDAAGRLWIKSYDGQIYQFDKSTEKFVSLSRILRLKSKVDFGRILSTENGSLWVGTISQGVIVVPDVVDKPTEYQWYNRKALKGTSLPNDTVNFFYRDQNSLVLIGTPNGLVAVTKNSSGKFNLKHIQLPESSDKNVTAAMGIAKMVFIGTAGGNLLTYNINTNTVTQFNHLTSGNINALAKDRSGRLVYATTSLGEVVLFTPETKAWHKYLNSTGDKLGSIFVDTYGDLWIEPSSRGIVRFEMNTKRFSTFTQKNDAFKKVLVNHFKVFADNEGTVWALLRDGGFGYYDRLNHAFNYFYNEPGGKDRRFSNLVVVSYYDPSGVLWLNTDERGLEKIIMLPDQFKQKLLAKSGIFKSDNEVRGLMSDHLGRIWVGAKSNRVYVLNHNQEMAEPFVNKPKEGIGTAHSFFEDRQGVIYIGTKADGLFVARPVNSSCQKYILTQYKSSATNQASISSDQIYSITGDASNNIWIGTFDHGLNQASWKNGSLNFKRWNSPGDYPNGFQKIRHMEFDGKGRLWLGTTDGLVVFRFIGSSKTTFSTFFKRPGDPRSLGNNDVQFVYRDSRNRMWIATSGGGLNLAKESKQDYFEFDVFSTKNGLASDYVLSCIEDQQKNIWVATKSSISRFNPNTFTIRNFNSFDGATIAGFSEGSACKLPDGQLVFGTIQGLLSFDPAKVHENPIKANLVITNLQVNNKDLSVSEKNEILTKSGGQTEHITLRHDQNIITLDYAILDYRFDDRPTFFYKLNGFDTEWKDNKYQRRATYTNLPPGDYLFEVKCIDKTLYQNSPSKKLAITILPPFWRTWWAYLVYIVIAAFLLETSRRIGLTMLRLRHKIAVEKKLADLKLSFFTNVSHELRTPLTLIINPVEELLKKEDLSGEARQNLSVVHRNAGRMERFVNELLDLRKLQNGKARLNLAKIELVSFVAQVGECFSGISRARSVRFSLSADQPSVYTWLDPDKMETVLYNLLGNAFKFAPGGTTVTVKIATADCPGSVSLSIHDQGCGVPEDDLDNIFQLYHESKHADTKMLKGTGIGLALVKDFITLHQGEIHAENHREGGLLIKIKIPINEVPDSDTMITGTGGDHAFFTDMPLPVEDWLADTVKVNENPGAPLLLLVEDNDDMRLYLHSQLLGDYRVQFAINGEEGLKLAKSTQPDIILSDVMMPKMDGIQMLDALKNDQATSHIPVILLSARSAVESQIAGLNYGADYYITKPFNNEFLLAAVANIVQQRKRFTEKVVSSQRVVDLGPGQVVVTSKDEIFLQKVVAIVEQHMADPEFNIDTVAEMVNMARPTFYKKFKSLTQMAPVEFVREMRLRRAQQYLDAGAGNVAEVSFKVGFASPKYFSTCFKAKYNVSPSDYLKTNKNAVLKSD